MHSSIAPGSRPTGDATGPSRASFSLWKPLSATLFAAVLGAVLAIGASPAGAQSTPGVRPATPDPVGPVGPAGANGLRSDPRAANTAVEQASRLLREGQTALALTSLEESLKRHPRDAQLRFLYGVVLAGNGRADDAILVFEQLTQEFPELPEPHNNLAVMLAGRGDLDRARAALENAVRALPGYALAQENLGDVYLRMAARAYERAGQLDAANSASREKLTLARELMARIAPRAAAGAPAAGAARAPAGAAAGAGAPAATPATTRR
ncbi:MAG: tetratricopeptide repeat protein [Burkholderiales bacterium]|nr:tetratricopeptide repeat protein [Burkholderiales bacterium]